MSNDLLYPYVFSRQHVSKPWAGRRLHELFVSHEGVPDGTGETIELGTLSGLATPIDNGNAAGLGLTEVAARTGWKAIVGFDCQDFPLMVKFLDTVSPLSVQVHPADDPITGQCGKHESWVMLACDEGSCIYQGVEAGVKDEAFWAVMKDGDPADVLIRREVEPYTFVDSPVGMVHAIGPGITLLEVQQNSNTTYRIRDWPTVRQTVAREMHVDLARGAARLELAPPPIINLTDEVAAKPQILRTGYPYSMGWQMLNGVQALDVSGSCAVLVVLEGELAVRSGEHVAVHLQTGGLCVIPAALGTVTLEPRPTCSLVSIRPEMLKRPQ